MARLVLSGASLLAIVLPVALGSPGTAVAATGSWALEPASWDFGTRLPGEGPTEAKEFELVNTGSASLTPEFISVTNEEGSGFAYVNETCHGPIASGGRCAIEVTFDPRSEGKKTGTLAVETSTPGVAAATAQLTGSGGEPIVKIERSVVDFPMVPIPAGLLPRESRQSVTVTNTGLADLGRIEPRIYGPGRSENQSLFRIFATAPGSGNCETSSSVELAPGQSCFLELGFDPREVGAYQGELELFDNAADSPQRIALSGTAEAEVVVPTPRDARTPSLPVLTKKPARRTRARNATFAFTGDELDGFKGHFECGLGGGRPSRSCKSPAHLKRLKPGRHIFSVRAVFPNNNAGPVLRYHWRIGR